MGLPGKTYSDNSFSVAALLTFSGGFLDAFTYVGHGKVFANSMTGNIVLIGVHGAQGDWRQALHYLPPIFAFIAGVFIAQRMRSYRQYRYLYTAALYCIFTEIIVLIIVTFLPASFPEMPLVAAIALVAAMQNSSFTQLEEWSYNSVMTTGNLRRFTEAVFMITSKSPQPDAKRQAVLFGLICFSFFCGTFIGALITHHFFNKALAIPLAVLLLAFYLCLKKADNNQFNK